MWNFIISFHCVSARPSLVRGIQASRTDLGYSIPWLVEKCMSLLEVLPFRKDPFRIYVVRSFLSKITSLKRSSNQDEDETDSPPIKQQRNEMEMIRKQLHDEVGNLFCN